MVLYDNNDLFPQYNRQKIFLSTKVTGQTGKSLFIRKREKQHDRQKGPKRNECNMRCMDKPAPINQVLGDLLAEISFIQ